MDVRLIGDFTYVMLRKIAFSVCPLCGRRREPQTYTLWSRKVFMS